MILESVLLLADMLTKGSRAKPCCCSDVCHCYWEHLVSSVTYSCCMAVLYPYAVLSASMLSDYIATAAGHLISLFIKACLTE